IRADLVTGVQTCALPIFHEQLGLGALTWCVLIAALSRFPADRRAQALGVVIFATVGEFTGSILWGVYHYRLHNLPTFVPPAHGLDRKSVVWGQSGARRGG